MLVILTKKYVQFILEYWVSLLELFAVQAEKVVRIVSPALSKGNELWLVMTLHFKNTGKDNKLFGADLTCQLVDKKRKILSVFPFSQTYGYSPRIFSVEDMKLYWLMLD